jgi:hypothetical protein
MLGCVRTDTGEPEEYHDVLIFALDIVDTGATCMELAVPALKDPPVGARVAHVAGPLHQSAVRFDHLEGVGTVVGDGHGDRG